VVGQTAVERERQVHILVREVIVISYRIISEQLVLLTESRLTLNKELIVNSRYVLVDTTISLIEDLIKVHLTLLSPTNEVEETAVLEPHLVLLLFHHILESERLADLTRT